MKPGSVDPIFDLTTPVEPADEPCPLPSAPVSRLLALIELTASAPYDLRAFLSPDHRREGFGWVVFSAEREPEESFAFDPTGRVIRMTCSYSYHNGDPYGHTFQELDAAEAASAIERLVFKLEDLALVAEERRLAEAEARRRTQEAEKIRDERVNTLLKRTKGNSHA